MEPESGADIGYFDFLFPVYKFLRSWSILDKLQNTILASRSSALQLLLFLLLRICSQAEDGLVTGRMSMGFFVYWTECIVLLLCHNLVISCVTVGAILL